MIPSTLANALLRGEVVLFTGAGVNFSSKNVDGHSMPMGNGLRDLLADKFLAGECKDRTLEEVATLAENEVGRNAVFRYVAEQVSGFSCTPGHLLLPSFRWKAIFSLNYDHLVEDAYRGFVNSSQLLKVFFKDQTAIDREIASSLNPIPYYKLHGTIDAIYDAEAPLILTSDTYVDFELHRKRLFRRLEDLAYDYPIVFAGIRLTDPHIKSIIATVEKEASSRPMYYFIGPNINQYDEALLAKRRITAIKATFDQFMSEIDRAVDPTGRKMFAILSPAKHSIEKHFRTNAPAPAGLTAFLTNNVEHVRPNLPTTTVPAALFYKGESQSWSPIEQELDIERRLYSTLVLKALGLEKSSETINVMALRGVAGAGKTVLLRRIAYDLAAKHDKLVLFVPPGANLRAEPLLELYDLSGLQLILVVDHAADQMSSLNNLFDRLDAADVRLTAIITDTHASFGGALEVLGERLKFKAELKNLEESEVDELLIKLRKHKSLGLLEKETPEKQKEAFEKVAEKQLLVALYEATQGKLLEDLIVEEYHRILLNEAQELYLLVCTLNRFRVPVRAALVQRVMGIGFRDFEKRFLGPLSGMVFAEVDPASRDYAYRSRHPHIADIVFRRVLDSQSKQIVQYRRVLEGINTSYSSDNDAMRRMLAYKNLRDLAPSLQERRDILELAQKVCGDDTFVMQQRAIIEMNDISGDLSVARKRLEQAESLRPKDNTIKHSKASLLAREASQSKDPLQRRALRSEAKDILRRLGGGDRSDPYVCSLMAKIAVDEIEDRLDTGTANPTDVARLSEDAQKALNKGLASAPDFEALVKESYRLRRVLKIGDRGVSMLERTLKDQPHLDYVATIYARAISPTNIEKALDALRKALTHKPQSKLLNQSYFEILLERGDDFRDELELPLRRAFTPEDQNLVMHIHAIRYYFMRFNKSEFQSALTAAERMRIPFGIKVIPRLPVNPIGQDRKRWKGEISYLGPASGYIKIAGMIAEVFFRPTSLASEDLWDTLATGSAVFFELRFNSMGPVAVDISLEDVGTPSA